MIPGQSIDRQIVGAAALLEAGRYAEAAKAFEAIVSLRPDLADCWYDLGWVRRRLGKFPDALGAYQQALDHGVARPEATHVNRAVILMEDQHRYAEAADELQLALALRPDFAPALMTAATLAEDRGRRPEATQLYRRLLAAQPENWEALARYANVLAGVAADDPVLARLRGGLARAGVSAADKASLAFALGRALDSHGDFPGAFDAYVQANRFSRMSGPPGAPGYDRAARERFVDGVIAAFPKAIARAARPHSRPPPIFICGMFRSGSTLVEQVLAAHPRVTAGGEFNALPRLLATALPGYPRGLDGVAEEKWSELAEQYLQGISAKYPGADVITDKRPENFNYIGAIKTMFPDAKIINTVRNPLDNCLSVFFLHLDQAMNYAGDLIDIGHYYAEQRRMMRHWKSLYGDDILDFDYDAFVDSPRPALERLLAFCELAWDDRCLAFHAQDSIVRTASVWQVRRPLYKESSGRSHQYVAQLAPLAVFLDGRLVAD